VFELIDMVIVRPIINLLFVIFNFVGDFGLAIIIFTIIVKFAMWPLLKKQLHQTRLMRSIQPKLAEIKKNCKGNRQMESLQTMDLYKRNNIKPFRSILTLLIQLPIFIAIFTAIRVMVTPTHTDHVDFRAYSFVRPLPRINELIDKQNQYLPELKQYEESESKDDLEIPRFDFHPKLFGIVELDKVAGFGSSSAIIIFLFALAAAATQFVMARQLMPTKKTQKKRTFKQIMKDASEGKQADQTELNTMMSGKMMKIMPIMMLFIMINLPGALVFYYMLTNMVTVAQQKYILAKDYDEAGAKKADKKTLKELSDIKEAKIVNKNSSKTNITRIKASDGKKRRK
jgi:YidC/Oxa1 family membrane protein insertase